MSNVIDPQLLDPVSVPKLIENFNRLLGLIDALSTALGEATQALAAMAETVGKAQITYDAYG